MRRLLAALTLTIVGAVAVLAGVALVYPPAALVLAGVLVAAVGVDVGRP